MALKLVTNSGWFAARRLGTENTYKIYAESFPDEAHLEEIVTEARQIVHMLLYGALVELSEQAHYRMRLNQICRACDGPRFLHFADVARRRD